jgi:sugar lactone lactonase YvrE
MTWQTALPQSSQPDQLGESPFWHSDEQRLYWVDIPGRAVRRLHVASSTLESWPMPSEPGCIAPAKTAGVASGLVIALRDGIYRATRWQGELKRLMQASHDTATTRFNDGKADPLGRFWAGTMYEPRDAALAKLWCMDARGATLECGVKLDGAVIANGLAWSPNAATLYWTDTPSHSIRAWDWNAEANTLSAPRVFHQWPGKPADWQPGAPEMPGLGTTAGYGGRPDGAAVDLQGNYWVAMFEGGRLVKLSPAGEELAVFPLPARCPTMPCFGGPDLKTLYVTTARYNRPAQELAGLPASGCVLSMRVDVAGLPVNFFLD